MPDITSLDGALIWKIVAVSGLSWLAIRFGHTLRAGQVPLIEQIARVSQPDLPSRLERYTRRLTTIWCVYFLLAIMFLLLAPFAPQLQGLSVGLCSLVLFTAEHSLRPYFFPKDAFPSLGRQIKDTVKVWRHPD